MEKIRMNINSRLPLNIIEVIFSKLSILNLAVCRVVCKYWNDLILNYYVSSSSNSIPHPLFLCSTFDHTMHCIDFNPNFLGRISFKASLGSQLYLNYLKNTFIISSCNGLLLIYTCVDKSAHKLICLDILNPITNEYFRLPKDYKPNIEDVFNGSPRKSYAYGFGISLKTKRYKVVRVPKFSLMKYKIEIFTVGGKNNQWRSCANYAPFFIEKSGVYFNGALYWIGLRYKEGNNELENVICCFDLENEKIESRTSLPSIGPSLQATLEAFNGSVYATFLYVRPCFKIEVWRMHNCGREDSWRREFVINDVPKDWMIINHKTYFRFVKCYEDGEILCLINYRFTILYNPKYGSIKILNKFERSFIADSICRLDSFNFSSLRKILNIDDGLLA